MYRAMTPMTDHPSKPSDKQISFAKRLADEKGIPLPEAAQKDRRATSKFIDEMMGNAGTGMGGSDRCDPGSITEASGFASIVSVMTVFRLCVLCHA